MKGMLLLDWLQKNGRGLLFTIVLSFIAWWLGSYFPLIGGPVFGIVIGVLINHFFGKPSGTQSGIQFSSKKVLQWSIIALGFGLNLDQVWRTGIDSLYVMIISLIASFAAAYGFGTLLGVPDRLKTLIGVGTGICGGSAIAAVSPIIEAKENEIAYSISTIFLFNIVAVLLFPPLGHWIGMSDNAFGLLAGTAVNDTSSVVAAGYAYSDKAGDYATIVKLVRTTMIIPVSLLFAFLMNMKKARSRDNEASVSFSFSKLFPWFIVWFLVASFLNTLGLFSPAVVHYVNVLAKFMIVMALTAVGLNADFRKMAKTGVRPILLGLIVWASVTTSSLFVLWITRQL
jgi:uncharacterized integral membrane protein (TIGR00698 family)